jgi:hypothetical protein
MLKMYMYSTYKDPCLVQFTYYYYLFTAIGFAPGGSGPYTTQLQQNTYNKNKYIP